MPKKSPPQPKVSQPKVGQSFKAEQQRLRSLPPQKRAELQNNARQRFPALLRLVNSAQTNPVVAQVLQKALAKMRAA